MPDNDPKELDPSWNDVPSGIGHETSSFEGPDVYASTEYNTGTVLTNESTKTKSNDN